MPGPSFARLLVIASATAGAAAALASLIRADGLNQAFLSCASAIGVTAAGIAAGRAVASFLIGIGGMLGLAVLAGSMVRGAVMVAAGLVLQYALAPDPVPLWGSLLLAWLVAKIVEMRAILPALTQPAGEPSPAPGNGPLGTAP